MQLGKHISVAVLINSSPVMTGFLVLVSRGEIAARKQTGRYSDSEKISKANLVGSIGLT